MSRDPRPVLRVWPPEDHRVNEGLRLVLDGLYDVPGLEFPTPPRILDIGCHNGSASVFFAWRWPGAQILAFEPSPENAAIARINVAGIAELSQLAVVGEGMAEEMMLYDRVADGNTGERSLYRLHNSETGDMVKTVRARDLPPCDIVKIDTEGAELPILRDYPHLAGVRAIMLEWHREEDRAELARWLPTLGFRLLRAAGRDLVFVR